MSKYKCCGDCGLPTGSGISPNKTEGASQLSSQEQIVQSKTAIGHDTSQRRARGGAKDGALGGGLGGGLGDTLKSLPNPTMGNI